MWRVLVTKKRLRFYVQHFIVTYFAPRDYQTYFLTGCAAKPFIIILRKLEISIFPLEQAAAGLDEEPRKVDVTVNPTRRKTTKGKRRVSMKENTSLHVGILEAPNPSEAPLPPNTAHLITRSRRIISPETLWGAELLGFKCHRGSREVDFQVRNSCTSRAPTSPRLFHSSCSDLSHLFLPTPLLTPLSP